MHDKIGTTLTCRKYIETPREDALRLFPIGTTVAKESGSEIILGQVYGYHAPYWRVQYEDNDLEELLRQEVHRMTRSTPGRHLGTQPPTPPRR